MKNNTYYAYEGEKLNLKCTVKNESFLAQNNTFVLKHGEQNVDKQLVSDGKKESTLGITKVTTEHAGVYSCRLQPGNHLVGSLTVHVSPSK